MELFGFGKKKETTCDCGGMCEAAAPTPKTSTCDCGGACEAAPESQNNLENTGTGAFVKVLGPGCKKCLTLEENAKMALQQLGLPSEIEHITDFAEIASYGVMSTPALVVGGKVVSMGKVLKTEDVQTLLQNEKS